MTEQQHKVETWKDIDEFSGYQCSNLGRIRSLDRVDAGGRAWKGRVIKPWGMKGGQLRVYLRKDNKTYRFVITRIFAETFPVGHQPLMSDDMPEFKRRLALAEESGDIFMEYNGRKYCQGYAALAIRVTERTLYW